MKIACIGTRELRGDEARLLESLGRMIVEAGHEVVSGNALGADQAYARGANAVGPSKVRLFLPWATYEVDAVRPGNIVTVVKDDRYFETAAAAHPAWHRLSSGVHSLLARNAMIIEASRLVVALPDEGKRGGGGTGHGMRMAATRGTPVVNLCRGFAAGALREALGASTELDRILEGIARYRRP